jgi:hypothetical protein
MLAEKVREMAAADSSDERFKEHFERASQLSKQGRYDEAIA